MKRKLFTALFAAAALIAGATGPAAARDRDDLHAGAYRHGAPLRMLDITVRANGRTFDFGFGDRMFTRLTDRPFSFVPGLTYAYTDRCNRFGCVVFVYDDYRRHPVDRIFAPHLPLRNYAWRQARGFDPRYGGYGHYERDDRTFDERWRYQDRDDWRRSDDQRWDDRYDQPWRDGGPASRLGGARN